MKPIKRVTCVMNRLDSAGGAERVISVLCNRFVEQGIETTIIVRQNPHSVYPLDDRVRLVATSATGRIGILRNLKRNLKLRHEIKKSKPDVIISFLTPINIQTILFSVGLGIPVVVSERNNPETDINRRDRLMAKLLYPLCRGLVFQTEDAKNWFSNRIQNKGTVIPNPISENLPSRKEVVPGRIVSVGRLVAQKNQKMLIDAFAAYSARNPAATLTIYGQGPMKEELEQYINARGMQKKIILAGYCANVMEEIADAALFILPSDYEGMPNALIEAMGIGLPCISTDCPCGGPRYLIDDGINGVLVPVADAQAMTKAIERLMNDPNEAETIGTHASELKKRLDSHVVAQQWLDFCSGLVTR